MGALCEVKLWGPCVRSGCGGPVSGQAVGDLCEVRLWGPCVRSSCGGPV